MKMKIKVKMCQNASCYCNGFSADFDESWREMRAQAKNKLFVFDADAEVVVDKFFESFLNITIYFSLTVAVFPHCNCTVFPCSQ